jgi:hypothetical protein
LQQTHEDTWKTRFRLEDNTRILFQYVGKNEDWIYLAKDRDKWQGLVDTVIKLRDPRMRGIY